MVISLDHTAYLPKSKLAPENLEKVRDIGPDLRPNDYKKDDGTEAIAARGGMETLRPALQRLSMTRASAYRDAVKSFIEGYQEGIQLVMEEKEDSSKAQQEGNTDKNST
ncbi:hypothetical protein GOBAR_DD30638 [Gossypium barbadense]|nr:hypothetical protein GOBAR_DD30638 [Gossypium barbadense]